MSDETPHVQEINFDSNLKAEIEEIKTATNEILTLTKDKITNLEKNVSLKDEKIKDLENSKREKDGKINSLEKEIGLKNENIKSLEESEREKTEKINSLEKEIGSKDEKIKNLEESGKEKAEKINSLEKEIGLKNENIKNLEESGKEKAEKINSLEEEIDSKDGKIKDLEESGKEKDGKINSLEKEIGLKNENIKNLEESGKEKDEKINSLEKELKIFKDKYSLYEKIDEIRLEIKDLNFPNIDLELPAIKLEKNINRISLENIYTIYGTQFSNKKENREKLLKFSEILELVFQNNGYKLDDIHVGDDFNENRHENYIGDSKIGSKIKRIILRGIIEKNIKTKVEI